MVGGGRERGRARGRAQRRSERGAAACPPVGRGGSGVQGLSPVLCPQGMRGLEGTAGLPGPPGPRVGTAAPRAPSPAHPHSPGFLGAELSKAALEAAWEAPLPWAGTFLGLARHNSVLGPRALQRPPGGWLSPLPLGSSTWSPSHACAPAPHGSEVLGFLPAGGQAGAPLSLRSTFLPSPAPPWGLCRAQGLSRVPGRLGGRAAPLRGVQGTACGKDRPGGLVWAQGHGDPKDRAGPGVGGQTCQGLQSSRTRPVCLPRDSRVWRGPGGPAGSEDPQGPWDPR